MRSVATNSKLLSSTSYKSRTLPRATRVRSGQSLCFQIGLMRASLSDMKLVNFQYLWSNAIIELDRLADNRLFDRLLEIFDFARCDAQGLHQTNKIAM